MKEIVIEDADKNTVVFTSDMHFGHLNIAKMCNRTDNGKEFNTSDEMDEWLIEKWNSKVTDKDLVIDLGDFMFKLDPSKVLSIVDRLNFDILVLLPGNHGLEYNSILKQRTNVLVVEDTDILNVIVNDKDLKGGRCSIVACHYPIYEVPGQYRGAFHVYGHTHKELNMTPNSLHVGIDTTDHAPLRYEEVILKIHAKQAKSKL